MHDELLPTRALHTDRGTPPLVAPTAASERYGLRLRPAGRWVEATLAVAFVVITVILMSRGPMTGFDRLVTDWCDAHRSESLRWLARQVMIISDESPSLMITLMLSFHLSWQRRTVRPIFPVGSAAILSAVLVVGLKGFTDRPEPRDHGPVGIFSVAGGESYPSGHVLNAVVWYGLLALFLTPYVSSPLVRALVRVLPAVLAFTSTIYLDYHWFTDDLAGLVLGLLVYRVVRRIPWSVIPLPSWLDDTHPDDHCWP